MPEIIRNCKGTIFDGCDFVVRIDSNRTDTQIRLLQLTDMQVIDSLQVRKPNSLRQEEFDPWHPENLDVLCGNHIRSLIAQSSPDFIFITGDIVYGRFDDKGTSLEWFCRLMDSFEIPWAPVFGNHDNETRKGVAWQCEQFEKSKYCLFKRGDVSGNGNYTVGIAVGDTLVRIIHMLDSNGCRASEDEAVIKEKGILPDQMELVKENTLHIAKAQGRAVPAFLAFHIPTTEFEKAERAAGYKTDDRELYVIGVDKASQNGDFGCKGEIYYPTEFEGTLVEMLNECNVEAVFVGHAHNINTCIEYENIKWVFGLKTGQYDYHILGQLGGTLVKLSDARFEINHIPALVKYGPNPERKN